MESKLTLQVLAAYLPHGVQCRELKHRYNFELSFEHFTGGTWENVKDESSFKLLLRPLSDLTKPITHNGEMFVPIHELFKMAYKEVYDIDFDGKIDFDPYQGRFPAMGATLLLDLPPSDPQTREWKYGFSVDLPHDFKFSANGSFLLVRNFELYQKLLEWHFDVFGLLESGNALPLNDHEN